LQGWQSHSHARCGQSKLRNTLQITNYENEKNASPRDSLGLLTMIWKVRIGIGFCSKALGCFLELLVAKNGQHLSLNWRKPAKNSKLCFLEIAKNHLNKLV
jgi:hypothetical protein